MAETNMDKIKVGDIVRLKDNEDDQDYAKRFDLTGELEVSSFKDSIVFFKDKMWDSSIWRLELVEGSSTNPFLKTETRTVEVKRPLHVGDITPIGSHYHVTKTVDGICLSRFSTLMYIDDEDVDLIINNLQLYKEALQEVNQ